MQSPVLVTCDVALCSRGDAAPGVRQADGADPPARRDGPLQLQQRYVVFDRLHAKLLVLKQAF